MKKLIIGLLLFIAGYADAQLIGGGGRRIAITPEIQAALDLKANSSALSNYASLGGANTFTNSNIFSGQLTTQSIVPDANATQDIGTSILDYRDIHAKTLWSGSSLYFGKAAAGDIFFRNSNSSNNIFAGFFGTTGNYYLQSLGVRPADNGFRFQNYGTSYLGGDVTITGTANVMGALTTDNIAPVSTGKTIGSSSLNYSSVWATAFLAPGGAVFGTNSSTSTIGFRQGGSYSTNLIGGFFPSGRMYIQPKAAEPVDNGTDQLQVLGSTISTQYKLSSLNTAPASATATGTLGEIRVTATHIYVCTATNTWVRADLSTW